MYFEGKAVYDNGLSFSFRCVTASSDLEELLYNFARTVIEADREYARDEKPALMYIELN